MLKLPRLVTVWGACLVHAWAASASTLIPGGGPAGTDCDAEWLVAGAGQVATRGTLLACADGDPGCDLDGQVDGACTLEVSVCVLQTNPLLGGGCVPARTSRRVTVRRVGAARNAGVPRLRRPDLPVSTATCGAPTRVTLSSTAFRRRPISATFAMVATSSGPARIDADRLRLRCVPSPPPCPTNPDGGPSRLVLTTGSGTGSDLDLGWEGPSHNLPFVGGASLSFCLSACDAGPNSRCTAAGKTGPSTPNGATFGAPLPILTAGTPVCVVNRFAGDLTATADHRTGAIDATVHLLEDVYLTGNVPRNGRGQVCPQCSGEIEGKFGICIGGRSDGQVCRTDGTAFVVDSTGNSDYRLSSSCLPSGTPLTSLAVYWDPLRTGTASLTGSPVCRGQLLDDACGATPCDHSCTGNACVAMTADPTDPAAMVCVDHKGGLSQLCCAGNTTQPCFPTRGGGALTRTGLASPAVPDVAGTPFPATSHPVLASVFCLSATGYAHLDDLDPGLPAPGALLLPMTGRWLP